MIVSATGTNVSPIAAVTILGGRTQWEGVADSAGTQKNGMLWSVHTLQKVESFKLPA